jgi:hypothetical protein
MRINQIESDQINQFGVKIKSVSSEDVLSINCKDTDIGTGYVLRSEHLETLGRLKQNNKPRSGSLDNILWKPLARLGRLVSIDRLWRNVHSITGSDNESLTVDNLKDNETCVAFSMCGTGKTHLMVRHLLQSSDPSQSVCLIDYKHDPALRRSCESLARHKGRQFFEINVEEENFSNWILRLDSDISVDRMTSRLLAMSSGALRHDEENLLKTWVNAVKEAYGFMPAMIEFSYWITNGMASSIKEILITAYKANREPSKKELEDYEQLPLKQLIFNNIVAPDCEKNQAIIEFIEAFKRSNSSYDSIFSKLSKLAKVIMNSSIPLQSIRSDIYTFKNILDESGVLYVKWNTHGANSLQAINCIIEELLIISSLKKVKAELPNENPILNLYVDSVDEAMGVTSSDTLLSRIMGDHSGTAVMATIQRISDMAKGAKSIKAAMDHFNNLDRLYILRTWDTATLVAYREFLGGKKQTGVEHVFQFITDIAQELPNCHFLMIDADKKIIKGKFPVISDWYED